MVVLRDEGTFVPTTEMLSGGNRSNSFCYLFAILDRNYFIKSFTNIERK
jgi:hypothetical protein